MEKAARNPLSPRPRRIGWTGAPAGLALVLALASALGALPYAARAAAAATLTRGPYLQLGTESGVILRWRTDTATDSEVRYGDAPGNLTESAYLPALTTEHEVPVTGLAAGTRTYYSVGSSSEVLAGGDAEHSFDASPLAGAAAATRVWVLGDSGRANAGAAAVRDAYLAYPGSDGTDLVLMLGDNAYENGTDIEYQGAVFDMYPTVLRHWVLWPTLGNHDGHSADSATESGPYYDIFNLPRAGEAGGLASGTEAYYSFDYANIHFVCLDSYDSDRSRGGAMLTWLVEDVAATDQDWIIAFWHHPPYTKGSHDSDTESELVDMRENAVELLEDFGVDLVLAGHSHVYERSYLIDGHYGDSASFVESMKVDAGDGREEGDGAYSKAATSHQGAVYAVVGSSALAGGAPLDHPAMLVSIAQLGSLVLDVSGNRLDAVFLREDGSTPDHFTILKGPDLFPPHLVRADAVSASAVEARFDEPLEQTSAETAGNYAIDLGVSVLSATLLGDHRTVALATTGSSEGVVYTLGVGGVTDAAANPVASGEQAQFTWFEPVVVSFQDGAFPDAGYSGTRDAYLEEALPSSNHGSATALLVDGDDGGGSDLATLVRWDVTAIPAGAIVDAAAIEVEVFNSSSGVYELYRLLTPWAEAEATWDEAASGAGWHSPGAGGTGDRASDVLGTIGAGSTGAYTIPLNVQGRAAVQRWIGDPSSNHGIIFADSDEPDGLDFRSREAAAVGDRPRLSVTYHLPLAPDVEPPSVPTGLGVTAAGQNFVALGWSASTDNVAVAHYEVVRDGGPIAIANGTTFTDSTVAPETAYDYQVRAIDASGNASAASDAVAVTTDPVSACTAPDGDSLLLELDTVSTVRNFEVCSAITAHNGYEVTAPGNLTLGAGSVVVFGNGFSVAAGGTLTVEIDPALHSP